MRTPEREIFGGQMLRISHFAVRLFSVLTTKKGSDPWKRDTWRLCRGKTPHKMAKWRFWPICNSHHTAIAHYSHLIQDMDECFMPYNSVWTQSISTRFALQERDWNTPIPQLGIYFSLHNYYVNVFPARNYNILNKKTSLHNLPFTMRITFLPCEAILWEPLHTESLHTCKIIDWLLLVSSRPHFRPQPSSCGEMPPIRPLIAKIG